MIGSAIALLIMQSGVNPAMGGIQGIPEELRDRHRPAQVVADQAMSGAARPTGRLGECLALVETDASRALDFAQRWRETAKSEAALTQAAHCLGMGLTALGRFSDAREAFALAEAEAPIADPAYRARLAAMGANAALAAGDGEGALPLVAGAIEHARPLGNAVLTAELLADKARVLVALTRLPEAGQALSEARLANPADPVVRLLSATLARRTGDLGEAQSQIEYAAALAPRDAAIGLEAGVIAALAGRDDDARRSFASVVALAPQSEEAAIAKDYLAQLGG